MNDILVIQSKIYEIRGQKVMLDRDLAAMYGVETKVLNQSVKRNMKRFDGDDFMFRLTKDETKQLVLRSQIVTLNKGRGYNIKYLPFAFTELGVAMLSSVLNSDTAINVNRDIMRAFVTLRHIVSQPLPDSYAELRQEIQALRDEMEDILHDQNDINESTRAQLDAISTALAELQAKEPPQRPRRRIGFVQEDEK
ncbi:MAG: ORF6N domain-containing protein [Prevotella sp.]|nr:ORF6N domain-containing protein [Prevotella sp.]